MRRLVYGSVTFTGEPARRWFLRWILTLSNPYEVKHRLWQVMDGRRAYPWRRVQLHFRVFNRMEA